jgi:hypothetical protein
MAGARVGRSLAAIAVSTAALALVATPASATTIKPQGPITCAYATTYHFNPPLTPGLGTPVAAGVNEVVTVDPASLSGCAGTATPPVVPTSGAGEAPIVFKLPTITVHTVRYAGGCERFPTSVVPKKTNAFTWTATGATLAPTKAPLVGSSLVSNLSGNLGYTFSGTALNGSFNGTMTIDAFFDAASTSALTACIGDQGGPISSATVDPTISSISVGG